jgi:hypothetical protein
VAVNLILQLSPYAWSGIIARTAGLFRVQATRWLMLTIGQPKGSRVSRHRNIGDVQRADFTNASCCTSRWPGVSGRAGESESKDTARKPATK